MMMPAQQRKGNLKGRGTAQNPPIRFERESREAFDDGWDNEDDAPPPQTTLMRDATRSIIARNDSPDLSFVRSINPYRGCEHGCIYCFARPTHAYLGLSPGLDFETKIVFKPEAATLLEKELSKPGYVPQPIVLGSNTDPYQPVERTLNITREMPIFCPAWQPQTWSASSSPSPRSIQPWPAPWSPAPPALPAASPPSPG